VSTSVPIPADVRAVIVRAIAKALAAACRRQEAGARGDEQPTVESNAPAARPGRSENPRESVNGHSDDNARPPARQDTAAS
jgi:hypothetical protein